MKSPDQKEAIRNAFMAAGVSPDLAKPIDADEVVEAAKRVGPTGSTADKIAVLKDWRKLDADARALTLKTIAKALGVAVADLKAGRRTDDDADSLVREHALWPTPVDGNELADDIHSLFKRHILLPEHAGVALTLIVLATHHVHAFEQAPYLNIDSPTRRCGKSTVLELVAELVAKPLACSGSSAAALFRALDACGAPTLIVDEADKVFAHAKDNPDLVAVINAGNRRGGRVLRCVGDDFKVKSFACFGVKIIAGISGAMPDTISDRSVSITLARKPPGATVERRAADWRRTTWSMGERAARWANNVGEQAMAHLCADAPRPLFLDDRAADTWTPLFAVAKAIGGSWPRQAWDAARSLSGARDEQDDTPTARILRDCRLAFHTDWDGSSTLAPSETMTTETLVTALKGIPESPWSLWNRRHGLDARSLGRLLGRYGIGSKNIRSGGQVLKGYDRASFKAAWDAYCADSAATDGDEAQWARWVATGAEAAEFSPPLPEERYSATTARNSAIKRSGEDGAREATATRKAGEFASCSAVAPQEGEATDLYDDDGVDL